MCFVPKQVIHCGQSFAFFDCGQKIVGRLFFGTFALIAFIPQMLGFVKVEIYMSKFQISKLTCEDLVLLYT